MSRTATRTLVVLAVLLAAGAAALLTARNRSRREAAGAAQRTVATLMNTVVEITGLMWSAEDRKALGPAAASARAAQAPEIRRLSQDSLRFFKDPGYGRAATGMLLLFRYGPVEVGEGTLRADGTAAVPVTFTPGDVFGIAGTLEKLPPGERPPLRTLRLRFVLERQGDAWVIAGTEGDLAYEIRRRAGGTEAAAPRR